MQLFLIFLAAFLYGAFTILLARMSGKIDIKLGAAIFATVSAVVPLALYLADKVFNKALATPNTVSGYVLAVVAGVVVASWNMLVLYIFARGGNASVVYPIIYGAGAIMLPAVAGWLLFKEAVSMPQFIGVVLIVAGIGLVAFFRPLS